MAGFKVSGNTEQAPQIAKFNQQSKSSGVAGATDIVCASFECIENDQADDCATNLVRQRGNLGLDSTSKHVDE